MSDEEKKAKSKPARRTTRSQSTSQTQFIKLDSKGKPPSIPQIVISDSEDSFQSTILDSTGANLDDLEDQANSSFDDNTFISEIDRKINSDINITTEQTDVERIENYKKIINNYRIFIVDLNRKSIEELKQKEIEAWDKETTITELQDHIETINKVKENMEVTAKDVIQAIPVFSGDPKELNTFVHTCDLYNELIAEANRPILLSIIKAKIRGEALAKISPMDNLNTWALLKTALRIKIKRPISFEFAQEDLSKAFQKKDESVEDYAKRFRSKLQKLNEASRAMAANENEKAILQTVNEKLAISKFEQNIRDNTVRILVSASAKTTLDEAIQIALHKDLMEKHKNIKNCGFCGLANHSEDTCRKKKASENQNKFIISI